MALNRRFDFRLYLARLALLAGTLVVACAAVEIGLRLFGTPPDAPDSPADSRWLKTTRSAELGWIFPADTTGVFKSSGRRTPVSTNAWGLRGPAVPRDTLCRRILVLGDSYAFGWGVADSAGFVRLLEDSLRARRPGTPIACLNGALPGYSIYQQVRMLEYVRQRTPLTAVVATISLANDPIDELRIRRYAPDHLADFNYALRDSDTTAARLIAASRLLTLLDERTTNLQFSLRNTDDDCRDLAAGSLRRLAAACREAHLPLVWVVVPRAQEIRSGRFWRRGLNGATNRLRRYFLDLARELGVPAVDLKPPLLAVEARQDAFLPRDAHWNEAGHRAVATAVLPVVLGELPASSAATAPPLANPPPTR